MVMERIVMLSLALVMNIPHHFLCVSPTCYGVVGPNDAACAADEHLYHIPTGWVGHRSLKQVGEWSTQVDLMPPAFVTWERQDPSEMALHGFRIDSLFGCSDRNDWNMPWPPPLEIYFSCNDYVPGGVNDMHCMIDEGWAFSSEMWMLASDACPRACQSCCYNECNGRRSCINSCEQPFDVMVFNGTHNTTQTIDDPFLMFLNYQGTYEQYVRMLEQSQFDQTAVFMPVEFVGGEFLEVLNVSMVTLNSDVVVHYTTDRSTPTFRNGILGTHVTIDRNTHLQAIAFEPGRDLRFASAVSSVDVRVRVLAPQISVISCTTDAGPLLFNATFPYTDQLCISAEVRVTAVNRRFSETFLRFALGGQAARASNPQGQTSVTFVVAIPGAASAIAWLPDMVPSDVVYTPFIRIPALVAVSRGWMSTVGLWDFVPERFAGVYERERSAAGGCGEVRATHIEPANVLDATELLGPAVLKGPDCKGGLWDLGDALSPNLLSLVERREGAVQGLRFDTLNRGLYVAEDVSELAPELLPRDSVTVEAIFTIDGEGGVALGGLVGCRLDASASGGFRYGKGWSLGYAVDAQQETTSIIWSLALERNEIREGLGGMRDFTAVLSPMIPAGELTHVAAVYDGRWARIYVNGALMMEEAACGERWEEGGGCGAILYPLATDDLYTQGRTAPLTLGVIDSTEGGALASHVGVLRMVRLFSAVLSAAQIASGARRRLLDGSSRLCPLGRFGAYEGLEPCVECSVGSVSPERGLEACEPCAPGFFTEGRGATDCLLCPPGMTTAEAGSVECTADDCLLGTHGCHPAAACADTGVGEESYRCTCNAGFVGDGVECVPACGDGLLVGEACDDGNTRSGDGCSRDCQLEADFSCAQGESGASACTCTAPPQVCCSKAHAVCRQLVEEGEAEQLQCVSEYGECLKASAGQAIPSPDVLLGQGSLSASPGRTECNALFEACSGDPHKSGGACLHLYSGCLKALEYQ